MNRSIPFIRFFALLLTLSCLVGVMGCTTGPSSHESASETPEGTSPSSESEDETDAGTTAPTTPVEVPTESESEAETDPEPPAQSMRPAQEVSVISMNLDANETTISARAQLLLPVLRDLSPDSIGVQEARGSWVTQLRRGLEREGYTRVGVDAGGNQDATGGYFATYIFYKTEKFNLIDSGTFWMSKTPDVPSIYDSTVDCNRTCTWALLEDKTTGFRYVHMNTHLDWMNMEVNKIQVSMIREQIERFEALGYPVFATGDYNCDEGTASYLEMLKSDVTADSKHAAEKSMNLGTYPNYGKYDVTLTKPIDYVFVTGEHMTVHEYRVIDDKPNGQYMSDHNGLFVRATVKAMPILSHEAPAFADGATVTVENSGSSSILVSFPTATDRYGVPAMSYRVEVLDASGVKVSETKIAGQLFLPTPPATLSGRLNGLAAGTTYTVRVFADSILGPKGEVGIEASHTFESALPPVTPEEMGAADLFDLAIRDGAPVDVSPKGHTLQTVGTPATVSETEKGTALVFSGAGNYKASDFKNCYGALEDGFTAEILLTVGEDAYTYANPAANYHAGGFGFAIDSGLLSFGVRLDGSYVYVNAVIEPNTTYHAVAVYNQAEGLLSLYLNGQLVQTATGKNMTHATDPGARYLCIGADSDASGRGEYPFTGALYTFRVYDAPATAGQALWLYEQTNS